jgi:hypothetical protein
MARSYLIAGNRFLRRSLVELSPAERQQLMTGEVVLTRAVEWPLVDRTPDFENAFKYAAWSWFAQATQRGLGA